MSHYLTIGLFAMIVLSLFRNFTIKITKIRKLKAGLSKHINLTYLPRSITTIFHILKKKERVISKLQS